MGAGTGVLSLVCAMAGAKHVYAIEACKGISDLSRGIVRANCFQDFITCINDQVENVVLPVDQVDIIVSEWMGMYLLHESMLNSIIYARDKYLKTDGHMYPSLAYLYMCPVEMNSYLNKQLRYWDNYNGFNFMLIKNMYIDSFLKKPVVEHLSETDPISDEKILASLDMRKVTLDDIKSIQFYDLKFTLERDCQLHGFAFWFDVVFETDSGVVTLSTSPRAPHTHWKQTITFLPNVLARSEDLGQLDFYQNETFECYLIMNQADENCRHYTIDIEVTKLPDRLIDPRENDSDDDASDSNDAMHPEGCDCGALKCKLIKAAIETYDREVMRPIAQSLELRHEHEGEEVLRKAHLENAEEENYSV